MPTTRANQYIVDSDILSKHAKTQVCFITGSRPQNLPSGNDNIDDPLNTKLRDKIRGELIRKYEKGIRVIMIGMAIGIDMWVGEITLELRKNEKYKDFKLIAAIPISNQSRFWTESQKAQWETLLRNVDEKFSVYSMPTYHRNLKSQKHLFQARNEFMVDVSGEGFAIYDGTPSGTHNCVRYALQSYPRMPITHLDTESFTFHELCPYHNI